MKVNIGDIVHYVGPDNIHRAGIVVEVPVIETGYVVLQLFVSPYDKEFKDRIDREGAVWQSGVRYSEEPQPHSWHWPEK